jgi:hypothetical protein
VDLASGRNLEAGEMCVADYAKGVIYRIRSGSATNPTSSWLLDN